MKSTFIVQKKGEILVAKKNTVLNDELEFASLYHRSKSMGWVIVADKIKAKNAHRATLKVLFLHDSHKIILLLSAVNLLLSFFVSDFVINIFLTAVCVFGGGYSIWCAWNSQSPLLRLLSTKDCFPIKS